LLGLLLPGEAPPAPPPPPPYQPVLAHPSEEMAKLLVFRGVNPLYGVFLINQLGLADRAERIQAMESVLDLTRSIGHFVRVPRQRDLPPGSLATTRLDPLLLQLGLATAEELVDAPPDDDAPREYVHPEDRKWVLTLAEKLRRLFDHDFPGIHGVHVQPVWAVGEILDLGGHFDKYVTSRGLQKQEGVIFRHLLRFILLAAEFRQLCPPDTTEAEWQESLDQLAREVTDCCREIDPTSTDKALEQAIVDAAADDDV
jgi:hypothetical protein